MDHRAAFLSYLVKTRDLPPGLGSEWIAFAREHDGDHALVAPREVRYAREIPGRGGLQELTEVAPEALEDHEGLRVAEANVELDDLEPGAGCREAAEKETCERSAAITHGAHDGFGDRLDGRVHRGVFVEPRQR